MQRQRVYIAVMAAVIVAHGNHALATMPEKAILASFEDAARSGTGQEDKLQPGAARQYLDNGNGTITATKTGLTWEKLSRDGSIHDYNTLYTWTEALAKVAALNTASFAGHTDWRLPNINELRGLSEYKVLSPAVDAAFNTSCVRNCTVLRCSCTQSFFYWSVSPYEDRPGRQACYVGIRGFVFYVIDAGN